MNIPAENNTSPSPDKRLVVLDPGRWSIKWKAKLNFLLRAIVAIGLLILLVNLIQRAITIRETNHQLQLLSDIKSGYLENYLKNLEQQIRVFAADRQTADAFGQFAGAFNNIETDNYLTSSVTGPDRINLLVEGYYKAEVLPLLNNTDDAEITLKTVLPDDNRQRILQYLYLVSNPKPAGSKGGLMKADDGSAYSYLHAQYHPDVVKFARQAGVSDILFVDYSTGYVTYSMSKNLDFATNLFTGPYKNSALGMAFKSAIAKSDAGAITYIDASLYMPAFYQPQVFIATPVFSGSQLLGAIVVALNNRAIGNLLAIDHEGTGASESLKSILIGTDMYYRCDDPEFTANKDKYIRKLKRNAHDGITSKNASRFSTTSMVQSVNQVAFSEAGSLKSGLTKYTTETGNRVFCAYEPLSIGNLKWLLVTQIDRSDALAPIRHLSFFLIGIALLIAGILYLMSNSINKSITSRLDGINSQVAAIINGQTVRINIPEGGDEIGSLNKAIQVLGNRLTESAAFVNELSNDNIDVDFPVTGEKDRFGMAMNKLKKSLVVKREAEEKRKKEDEIRNWTTQGIALFNEILRMDNNNMEKLSLNIIRNIVQYLSANQGGLFLIEEEDETRYLNLIATYAFDRQKFIQKRIAIGEGLAGACVLEKKTILTNKIPDNYIHITSGLGGSKPKCLMIVPLKKEDEVLGVLEIASFENIKPHEVELIEKVAESIAAALITVKLHIQTSQYLERFQQQAEEMKAQDEELRQNIEELQATHEQMERLKVEENERNQKMLKELGDYRRLLISVLNEVPEKIFLKDDKGRFVIANKLVAENYGHSVDEILGKSDFDFYPREQAMEYFNHEQEIVKSGKTQTYEEGDPSKEDGMIVRSIKKPFYIEHLGITGLFGVQFDISDIKRKEYEAKKLSDELIVKQKEIEEASVELEKEKALLDALMNSVPELIYFKDKESKFIRFSRSMLKLFGLDDPEQLKGKSDFDFFSEEHARPAYEDEQRIIKTGKAIIDLEEKQVMENGDVSWVNTTKMPLIDGSGKIIGTFGISKDISSIKRLQLEAQQHTEELKAQEEELRQNLEEMMATQEDLRRQLEENERMKAALGKEKALMDALMSSVPETIYFKDKQSKFIRVSKSLLKLFGLKKEEDLIGKSDFDFFSEEHARPAYEDEQKIIRTGVALTDHEEREVLANGQVNWITTTKMPLIGPDGDIIGTFGISKNISHIRRMQEEAQQHTEELKSQEEELRQNLEEMMTTQEDLRRQLEENEQMKVALSKEKALMDALMNNIPESIYFKDRQSRFIRVSKSMLRLFGLQREEQLVGKSDFDFFSEEHARPAFEDEQNIIRTGKAIFDLEEKEVLDDGRVNWVNTTKMPLISEDGAIIGTFGISKTITHIKKLQIEAEEKAKVLEETKAKMTALQKEMERLKNKK